MSRSERSHPRTEPLPRWFWVFAAFTLFLTTLPYLFSLAIQPEGTMYLGMNSNVDDHTVYAAWTKQAEEGRFFFDNRFTTDPQPRLTVNLFFLVNGWVAKVVGIPLAMHLMKFLCGLFFLIALYRLVSRLSDVPLARQLMMATAVFGGGIGWLAWRRYGWEAPIDVWQPEAFTFPSLMTVGLFCAALWLICVTWNAILDAEHSWRPVVAGALATLALTNFHTYDTLCIAIVGCGFLATMWASGRVTKQWLLRVGCIALGAIPALLWYRHVFSIDWVFQQRALTGTFAPLMSKILVGYGPLLILAMIAAISFRRGKGFSEWMPIVALVLLAGCIALQSSSGYREHLLWLSPPEWLAFAACGIAICGLYRAETPIQGLLFSWAIMGIIAVYYPGLFQRKLAMGLSVPIGILAGYALYQWFKPSRALALAAVALVSITSLRWIQREMQMATDNVSVTTLHNVFWDKDVKAALEYLRDNHNEKDVLISRPGQAIPLGDDFQHPTGYLVGIPDLNGLMTGFTGIHTYWGHWSETAFAQQRRAEVIRELYNTETTSEVSARALIVKSGATYLIAFKGQVADAMKMPPVSFYRQFGTLVYTGDTLELLRLAPPSGGTGN